MYQTKQTVYTITGSGTAAAEAGIVNCLAPGQKALCIINGKFAERWAKVCSQFGIEHKDLKLEYGQAATGEMIAKELKAAQVRCGDPGPFRDQHRRPCRDLEGICKAVRASSSPEALLIVDGITSHRRAALQDG